MVNSVLNQSFQLNYKTDFAEDKRFHCRLKELATYSYVDTASLLDREINHCKNILYYEDSAGELLCFALFNFEPLEEIETLYVGLTVCAESYKKFGLAKQLWEEIAIEAFKRQNILNSTILCWLTTPTPIVLYWFSKFLTNAEPFLDGSYTEKGKQLVEKLKRVKYSKIIAHETNPFILLKAASNTLYSPNERQRIIDASKKLGIQAFDNYEVDETNGDRFLILGYLPKYDE
jgi:hypothetical protein